MRVARPQKTLYLSCRIATQFNPVTFPAGEVQPTTRTHFEVGMLTPKVCLCSSCSL